MLPPLAERHPTKRKAACRVLYETERWKLWRIQAESTVPIAILKTWIAEDGWIRPEKSVNRIRYDEQDKAHALEILETTANIAETSRQTGIHKRTIGRWKYAKPTPDELPAQWRCGHHGAYGALTAGATCHLCGRSRS